MLTNLLMSVTVSMFTNVVEYFPEPQAHIVVDNGMMVLKADAEDPQRKWTVTSIYRVTQFQFTNEGVFTFYQTNLVSDTVKEFVWKESCKTNGMPWKAPDWLPFQNAKTKIGL